MRTYFFAVDKPSAAPNSDNSYILASRYASVGVIWGFVLFLLKKCVGYLFFANFLHNSIACVFICFSLKYIAQIWSDFRCYPWCNPGGLKLSGLGPSCSPECFQYRGTMDVFSKISRQVNALMSILLHCAFLFWVDHLH